MGKRPWQGMLLLAVMLPSSLAWADEPTVTYPPDEGDTGFTSWRGHRAGPHLFVDVGIGAFYAPDLAITSRPTTTTIDLITISTEGLHGPAALARWGLGLGVARYVDLKLGVGSFLGGAILSEGDQFFAYLKDRGLFDSVITVNSQTLNKLYRTELEAAFGRGEIDFQFPGIEPPTPYFDVQIRSR